MASGFWGKVTCLAPPHNQTVCSVSGPAHLGAPKCTSVSGLSPATIRAAVNSHNPTQPVLSGPQPGQVTAGPRKPAGCVGPTCPNLHALFLQVRTPACLIPPCAGPLVQRQLGPCPLTGLLDRKASQHQFGRGSVCVLREEWGWFRGRKWEIKQWQQDLGSAAPGAKPTHESERKPVVSGLMRKLRQRQPELKGTL